MVVNARIATGDPKRPWATAVAFDGDVLAVLGVAAEIQKLATPATRVIDAHGQIIHLPPQARIGSTVQLVEGDDGVIRIDSPSL